MTTYKGKVYKFGEFQFNTYDFSLSYKNSYSIKMSMTNKRLLQLLLRNHSQVVSHEDIILNLSELTENINVSLVYYNIYDLRKVLEYYEPNNKYIKVVRNGYIFVGPVSIVNSEDDTKSLIYHDEVAPPIKHAWTKLKTLFSVAKNKENARGERLLLSITSTYPGIVGKIIIKDPYRLKGVLLGGKYLLEGYLGGGGMGAVYLASQNESHELVAVKILKPDIQARSPDYVRLFNLEAEAAKKLNHPNIVKIYDSGTDDDISYMVMELLEGRTLEDEITSGNTKIEFVSSTFRQICQAFIVAHEKNIIHLDIKPGNIFIVSNPQQGNFVKVIDFGLSKILSSESGTTVTKVKGTDKYCSPEHFGGKLTKQSDVYSLGATLYNMLTGVIPFGNSYVMAKMYPNRELPPIPSILAQRPDLPEELDKVIDKALSKKPADRQQSVWQLLDEFEKALSDREKA